MLLPVVVARHQVSGIVVESLASRSDAIRLPGSVSVDESITVPYLLPDAWSCRHLKSVSLPIMTADEKVFRLYQRPSEEAFPCRIRRTTIRSNQRSTSWHGGETS